MQTSLRPWRSWLIVAAMVIGAPGGLPAQQVLLFQPPQGWVMAPLTGKVVEFIRPGDRVDQWHELVTLQSLEHSRSLRLGDFYESLKATRAARCPDSTEWELIEQSQDSLYFEERLVGPCEGHPPQAELTRLVLTKDSFYRVAYATRGEFTPEVRATWLAWLRSQKVRK